MGVPRRRRRRNKLPCLRKLVFKQGTSSASRASQGSMCCPPKPQPGERRSRALEESSGVMISDYCKNGVRATLQKCQKKKPRRSLEDSAWRFSCLLRTWEKRTKKKKKRGLRIERARTGFCTYRALQIPPPPFVVLMGSLM